MTTLLEEIEKNEFIEKVRMNIEFDKKAYQDLLKTLKEIKNILHNQNTIEKRLASNLYEIPKLTYVWYNKLKDNPNYKNRFIMNQLEEAWIELDALIGEEILGQGQ